LEKSNVIVADFEASNRLPVSFARQRSALELSIQ
jgi:hypothetical protein